MSAALDQHQMCTERRGRGNPVAASRARHAPAAHQLKSSKVPVHFSSLCTRQLGRGLTRSDRFLFRRGFCGPLTEIALARVHAAALLTDEQIAALLSPVLPADQTIAVEAGLTHPIVQPPHHLERLSQFAGFDDQQPSERPLADVQILLPREQYE